MDPASALAALVSALSLALEEMRRRDGPDKTNELREALLDLEVALGHWHDDSRWTNDAARDWSEGLPESLNELDDWLESAVHDQWMGYANVREMFVTSVREWRTSGSTASHWGRPAGRPRRGGGQTTTLTLEDVLRVYAPEVLEMAPLLIDRHRRLRQGIRDELISRWQDGGRAAVDAYIVELERSTEGLERFRRELAAFIAREFPLGAP